MYKIFIDPDITRSKTVFVQPGEQYIDENGDPMVGIVIDEETGESRQEPFINETGKEILSYVKKTEQELEDERNECIAKKAAEIQAEVDAYEAGKEYQRQHGGPAPVAEFEIKKICNEYDCKFEVIIRE